MSLVERLSSQLRCKLYWYRIFCELVFHGLFIRKSHSVLLVFFVRRDNKDANIFYLCFVRKELFKQKKNYEVYEEGVLCALLKIYFETRNRRRQNKETPIETNRRTREIAMRLNLSNSGVHDRVKRLGVSSSWKNKITFWTISKFGYIYWKWLDSKKWLDTDVCSQGIKRVSPLPLQIQ